MNYKSLSHSNYINDSPYKTNNNILSDFKPLPMITNNNNTIKHKNIILNKNEDQHIDAYLNKSLKLKHKKSQSMLNTPSIRSNKVNILKQSVSSINFNNNLSMSSSSLSVSPSISEQKIDQMYVFI